jgi:hypothetical protein
MPMPVLALKAFAHANEGILLSSVPKSAIGAYMQFPKTGLSLGVPRVLPCTNGSIYWRPTRCEMLPSGVGSTYPRSSVTLSLDEDARGQD